MTSIVANITKATQTVIYNVNNRILFNIYLRHLIKLIQNI